MAGRGTRFLPITKAIPKELLPIIDKPLIQFAAEEAICAGIKTLIFITSPKRNAIENYFNRNETLEKQLEEMGQPEKVHMIRNILPEGIDCKFVTQDNPNGLGDAILCSEKLIGEHPFAVILADDLLVEKKRKIIRTMVNKFNKTGCPQIAHMKVNGPEISKYGVVIPGTKSDTIVGIKEKPPYKLAPSNMAAIGRYILIPEIFKILRKLPLGHGGELQLTDAIHQLAKLKSVSGEEFSGQRFDCGCLEGYIAAIKYYTRQP